MDEELETLVLRVRADTRDFAAGVGEMRALVEGPLTAGVEQAGRAMENAMGRFIRSGKFGFDDLKRSALSVLAEIAQAQLRTAIGGSGAGLGSLISGAAMSLLGAPGRATGGPVSPGRAYRVGERGPELFVPTVSGRVEAGAPATGSAVTINVNVASSAAQPALLQRSARQVARAVQREIGGAR